MYENLIIDNGVFICMYVRHPSKPLTYIYIYIYIDATILYSAIIYIMCRDPK
jgi:hypothetical protein